ncbi:MAG: crossover junction endodeoxyribonuclease RuvC [Patescibacteria group bacterium]|nr:crossover junction endodeoxyribonuclease RuvC [Patescibacteria group bacterium]
MKILAIDSGLERTGIALINEDKLVFSSLIETHKKNKLEERIRTVYRRLEKIIQEYEPEVLVMESLFLFKNKKTIISVSQVQGAVLLLAAQKGIKVEFLTPLQIKQALCGFGRADKKSIQKIIRLEFKVNVRQDDQADAVACGLAYRLLNRSLVGAKSSNLLS